MSIETEADLKALREIGRIVRLTLDLLERHAAPGATTGELDERAARFVAGHGARSAPALVYDFPGTVMLSVNEEIVHALPGDRVLSEGDVLKLDVTLEKAGYMADAARTILVGESHGLGRRLRACVQDAFASAASTARAGARIAEVGRATEKIVRKRGFFVVPGLEGHGIGRTIHEAPSVPNHFDPRRRGVLKEGMVLTIEPIISVGRTRPVETADGWTIRTGDGSLAAHHEHTLVVTRGRPILLTAA